MNKKIKFSLVLIMFIASIDLFSQTVFNLNNGDEHSYDGTLISKTENLVIKNIPQDNLLLYLESYCDSLQTLQGDKYLDHSYVFFIYELGVLDEVISLTMNDLYNYRNKIVAILKYHQKRNGNVEKQFMLLNNGSPLKYYIDGVEKSKVN